MKQWEVTLPNGEINFVTTEDDQTPVDAGYPAEECSWVEKLTPATAEDTLEASMRGDPVAAEGWARAEIERRIHRAIDTLIPDDRRKSAIKDMWYEVQRLKLAMRIDAVAPAVNAVPDTEADREREYPMIMALAFLAGATPPQVIDAINDRYWVRVRAMSLLDARLILAHDEVAAAATVDDKLAAAFGLDVSTD